MHILKIILGGSGDITPVSFGSELEINTEAALTSDYDITVTEDDTITAKSSDTSCPSVMDLYENNSFLHSIATPKAVTPSTENVNVCKNIFQLTPTTLKHVDNVERKTFINRIYNEFEEQSSMKRNLSRSPSLYDKDTSSSSKNLSTSGCSKWSTEKEKFLESSRSLELAKAQYVEKNIDMLKNLNIDSDKSKITKDPSDLNILKLTPGSVVVKEKYIEPSKVSRVSRSFHGKSSATTSLDIASAPRRASDGVSTINLKSDKRKFASSLSQPPRSPSKSTEDRKHSLIENLVTKPRFTTRIVDEAEHAASVGIANYRKKNEGHDRQSSSTEDKQ